MPSHDQILLDIIDGRSPGGDTFTPSFPKPVSQRGPSPRPGLMGLVTGEGRISEDIPELPASDKMGFRMALGRGDLGKLGILKRVAGEVDSEIDAFGNVIVDLDEAKGDLLNIPAGRYYLNKPGLSGQDVNDILTTGAIEFFPVVKGARFGARVLGKIGRAIGAGIGAGSGVLAQDALAKGAGSKQPFDVQLALVATAFGVGFEGAAIGAEALTLWLGRRFISNARYYRQGEGLTPEGRGTLERLGLDPDKLTEEFVEKFTGLARKATEPGEALAVTQAQTLPRPVRLSRGNVNRDVNQQGFEDAAALGQLGEKPKTVMRDFRAAQQAELRENVPLIQERIGGVGVESGEGMRRAQERLYREQLDLKGKVETAYALSLQSGSTTLSPEIVDGFAGHLRNRLMDGFDDLLETGSGNFVLKRLEHMESLPFRSGVKADVDAGAMYKWRKQISGRESLARGTPEGAALTMMRKEFDNFIEGVVDNALFKGDSDTIDKWRKAIAFRRELGKKFESNEIVKKLIEVSDESGSMGLRYQPSESLNFVFGASDLGGRTGSANALKKMKSLLGEGSPEWLGLKEEAVMRLFRRSISGAGRGSDVTVKLLSGENFARSLDDALRKSPEVMRVLFSKSDISLLAQFKEVALRATSPVRGATNPSGTAGRIALLIQQMQSQGIIGRAASGVIDKLAGPWIEAAQAARLKSAVGRPLAKPSPDVIPGLGGMAGTAAAGASRNPAHSPRGPQTLPGLMLQEGR